MNMDLNFYPHHLTITTTFGTFSFENVYMAVYDGGLAVYSQENGGLGKIQLLASGPWQVTP